MDKTSDHQIVPGISVTSTGQATVDPSVADLLFDLGHSLVQVIDPRRFGDGAFVAEEVVDGDVEAGRLVDVAGFSGLTEHVVLARLPLVGCIDRRE